MEIRLMDSHKLLLHFVKVCVNNLGNVISSKYTQRGSTTTDQHLASLATQGAKKYKFSPNDVPEQCHGQASLEADTIGQSMPTPYKM